MAELLLVLKNRQNEGNLNEKPTFTTQYLHPYYYFSFSQNPKILQKINTEESWVDTRGFRGEGPEKKGSRKLAFLLGGSVAFGMGASNNSTSITGVLNKIQNEYFFVNAGVPSWNSYQELLRFLKQVLPEKPVLVISLSGINDFFIGAARSETEIPLDAPESYETLDCWVEDIRSPNFRGRSFWSLIRENKILRHVFVSDLWLKLNGNKNNECLSDSSYLPQARSNTEMAVKISDKFLENMSLMHELSEKRGIDFHVFFQPYLLANNPEAIHLIGFSSEVEKEELKTYELYEMFAANIKARKPHYMSDFHDIFSHKNENELKDLFIDTMHFRDAGYEKLARLIWEDLKKSLQRNRKTNP